LHLVVSVGSGPQERLHFAFIKVARVMISSLNFR
jgi:hypothetical protein